MVKINKEIKTLIISIIFTLVMLIIGISISFYAINKFAKINPETIRTKNLEAIFQEGNKVTFENSATFMINIMVINNSSKDVKYNIIWDEINNNYKEGNILIALASTVNEYSFNYMLVPNSGKNLTIGQDFTINKSSTHNYTVYFLNQSNQKVDKKLFNGKIKIIEAK